MSINRRETNGSGLLLVRAKRRVRRVRVAAIAALAVCAVGVPAMGQQASVTRTGIVTATLSVHFSAAPPAGSTVSCGLGLASNDALGPTDGKSAQAPVKGTSATCTIAMHYEWHLASANSTMAIIYSVTGPVQSSSSTYEIIKVPANGSATHVAVSVTQ